MLFPVIHLSQVHSLVSYTSTTQTKEHNGPNIKQHVQSSKVKGNLTMVHKGRAKRGAIFICTICQSTDATEFGISD